MNMWTATTALLLLLVAAGAAAPAEKLPAFPGAEGRGAATVGGRGDKSSLRRRGYRGGPLEIPWGGPNTLNKGSIVILKALPKTIAAAKAPVTARFSHWTGLPEAHKANAANPLLPLIVDRDMTLTAHFRAAE